MTDLVNYLIDICSFVFTTLYERWGGDTSLAQFDLAYAWILCILAIAFIFIFSLVPLLFKWIFNMFGKFGRN